MALLDAQQSQPVAHVIFCVDNSGSMQKTDAKSEDGQPLSRTEAVARCCRQLVQQQACEKGVVYTHILFNQTAEATFVEKDVGSALSLLQQTPRPKHGTNFASAWALVEKTVQATRPGLVVHVVFLSDGRPGELPARPPSLGAEKPTSRWNGM
eukprot:3009838-Rhodomonas_salina.3